MATDAVGSISGIWRFPVKSMQGEQLDAAEVVAGGILGDRAYALIDTGTGRVVSAKHPTRWPDLLACRATFVEPPRDGEEAPPVEIELADGSSVRSDAPDADAALSRFFGHEVRLERAAPEDYTIDQYHPDEEDYDPEGHRDEVTQTKLGTAFFRERGMPPAVAEGSFMDLFPFSVLTTATLDHLRELEPESDFDLRRFRMNLIVETQDGPGFAENEWIGRSVQIGDEVRLGIAMPDPRCVMPSLAQPGLPRDKRILKTLARHSRIDLGGALYPCAGVYATLESGGIVRAGDRVTLA